MRFVFRALLLAAACCSLLPAQTPDRFAAYEHCTLPDDLLLMDTTPLPSGVEGRTVKTIMGSKQVPLAGGTRLMYAYPQTEPFANVKIEQIPADSYAQARQDLVANFEQILTGDDSSTRNYALKPRLNGLEIYGLDRKKLEGSVLGIYLFFVDRTHTATTIYFLNQDPELRRFSSLEEYAKLRDSFLESYTACAAGLSRSRSSPIREASAAPAPETPTTPLRSAAAEPVAPGTTASLPDAPLPTGAAAALAASAATAPESSTVPAAETAAAPAHRTARGRARRTTAASARKAAKPSAHKTAGASASRNAKHPASKKKKAASH